MGKLEFDSKSAGLPFFAASILVFITSAYVVSGAFLPYLQSAYPLGFYLSAFQLEELWLFVIIPMLIAGFMTLPVSFGLFWKKDEWDGKSISLFGAGIALMTSASLAVDGIIVPSVNWVKFGLYDFPFLPSLPLWPVWIILWSGMVIVAPLFLGIAFYLFWHT